METRYEAARPRLDLPGIETRHEALLRLAEDVRLATGASQGMGADLDAMVLQGEGNTPEYGYRQEAQAALLNKAANLADLLADELKREFGTDSGGDGA
ncbi:hypothetical protein [Vreelandella utahensis]|uniref:hypothetical protein n=1 Tax=Vreelandella halophila TaxID=86177 RepID=UPI00098476F6|nr:hypothetical protein [Halomonas utahensis]